MNTEINKLFKIEQEKIITSSKIMEINNKVYELSKKLNCDKGLIEQYEDLLAELSLAYQEEMFARGFKLGMKLYKEVYD